MIEFKSVIGSLLFVFMTLFSIVLVISPTILFSLRDKSNDKVKAEFGLLFAKEGVLTVKGIKVQGFLRTYLVVTGVIFALLVVIKEATL
ncbi:hypothetical protein EGH82_21670 [Vibrio ponticus]|uniref:Uncharacterized protein n=1 Tax=Vibrio ponticus TaxID=265668 RepID=A0A3N3DTC8_9VIBR|nr:hypothetical protein [Vibrio ponticus]ROV57754.1 hypothetical protein EGH82_21670 [Vibrio ponticus]